VTSFPCGGGFEYLHRSPASRKMPATIEGFLYCLVYNWATLFLGKNKYGDQALHVGGVSNLRL
jgi:hypothetical protein